MGMTIDDNVDFLNGAKKFFEDIANDPRINETVKTFFVIESLENSISIMRKYQKIQEIINEEVDPNICNNFGDVCKVQAIREVIEDGNDN